jgi:hypothetical protein
MSRFYKVRPNNSVFVAASLTARIALGLRMNVKKTEKKQIETKKDQKKTAQKMYGF